MQCKFVLKIMQYFLVHYRPSYNNKNLRALGPRPLRVMGNVVCVK